MAKKRTPASVDAYSELVSGIGSVLDHARRTAARSVNTILTAAYWDIGRRVVEHEQGGKTRASYGEELVTRLAADLTARHGRGFSKSNLFLMRAFYLGWEIFQTPSGKLQARVRTPEAALPAGPLARPSATALVPIGVASVVPDEVFPLSWSHYVRLLSVPSPAACSYYEAEAIRGGWSVRQLDRQIATQFYERLTASKKKEALIERAAVPQPGDVPTAHDLLRDPYLLEFLDLADEYGETDLEDALVRHLETFLLELGNGFTFVARQKRIRIDTVWYKMDLLLFHRRLRCLVVIDLKLGAFTHADAGQMNLYLNYAKEHLTEPGESDPVGVILCSEKSDTVVRYATGGINAKVFASRYLTALPSEEELREEVERTKQVLRDRVSDAKDTP
jgi:predicted nuclease of restriction endonuclease-like (RecB) superfamily